ncbi:MAG TPA: type VI secretion system tube protein Hcp [Pirellulales bacterium]|nr:type VI secretion system tube protein Hcp [Pirellulales bacterium]
MAAVDYFLKIDGIEGESQDSKHKNEIDVLSWSYGVANSGSMSIMGGGGSGKSSFNDISFTAYHSKASPKLNLASASGQHLKNAVLTIRKAGTDQQEYLVWKLTDVLVSSYQTGGSGSDVRPVDSFTLNYAEIEHEYKPQKADGSLDSPVKTGWNLMQNKRK